MAAVALDPVERRCERRSSGGGARWRVQALLRPGQPVTLLNISSRAALVESAVRLRPGARTEMQLAGSQTRASVGGRLDRCYVAAIEPIRYRGVLVFDERVDIGDDAR
jgi:hypothetical protein